MKLNSRDAQILQHIVRYADEIEGTITIFGIDQKRFESNYPYRNAISMPMQQIGELTKILSDEFKQTFSDVPWHEVTGMRNRFAHAYAAMNLSKIWDAAINSVPTLSARCREILSENGFTIPNKPMAPDFAS